MCPTPPSVVNGGGDWPGSGKLAIQQRFGLNWYGAAGGFWPAIFFVVCCGGGQCHFFPKPSLQRTFFSLSTGAICFPKFFGGGEVAFPPTFKVVKGKAAFFLYRF